MYIATALAQVLAIISLCNLYAIIAQRRRGTQLYWGRVLVAHTVKNLPAMQENQVQSLGWEDPLEKGMATHPRILAWRIPWTEEPGDLQSMGSQRVGHNWMTNIFTLSLFHMYDIISVSGFLLQ